MCSASATIIVIGSLDLQHVRFVCFTIMNRLLQVTIISARITGREGGISPPLPIVVPGTITALHVVSPP